MPDDQQARVSAAILAFLHRRFPEDADHLGGWTRFKVDLDAGSLELLEMLIELEDQFGVVVSDAEAAALTTVADLTRCITQRLDTSRPAAQ